MDIDGATVTSCAVSGLEDHLAAGPAGAFCVAMLLLRLRRRPGAGVHHWCKPLLQTRCPCAPSSTAACRRTLSSSAGDNNAVGLVHPRRTAAERVEHLSSALQRLPVFPLGNTVVFPGAVCPLYIFEARYRVLVQRLLRDGAHRCFGICEGSPGQPTVVGTVVEITHNHWNEDGSASVVTRGVCRFRAPASAMVTNAFGYQELPDGAAEVGATYRPAQRTGFEAPSDCHVHFCALFLPQIMTDEDDESSLLEQLCIAMGEDKNEAKWKEGEEHEDKEVNREPSLTTSELGERD